MSDPGIVVASGAVALREHKGEQHVLLVHRPRYDDWSLPKGKLDPGETFRAAAVREVEEETGVSIRLGPRLGDQVYPVQAGVKVVRWWVGRVTGDHDVSAYAPNAEIGGVRWVRADRAARELTYARDRETLAEALTYPRETVPLLVVRHAKARDKKGWSRPDNERPLHADGERQAALLPPELMAYAPDRIVSSSARRCWTTLAPYADEAGIEIEVTDGLSQTDATPESVQRWVRRLVRAGVPAALCSHRPVLPWVFEALGLEPPALEAAGLVVVHHHGGLVAALERVGAPLPG